MNTLANPHIAKLRAAPEPQPRFDKAGDELERMGEDALAAKMSAEVMTDDEETELEPEPRRTRERIIDALSDEEADIQTLAMRLSISTNAVRKHLVNMRRKGLASYRQAPRGGRQPVHIWHLTRREAAE